MNLLTCRETHQRICLRFLAFAFILFALAGGSARASETAVSKKEAALKELKETLFNFDEVAPGVYRSGLVNEESAALLENLGVKTVINFHDDPKLAAEESRFLKLFGIYMVWIPWEGVEYPRDEDIEKFLKLMDSPGLQPVLIHCKRGAERTGVALGCWRVSRGGWPAERAYQEMQAHRFRSFRYGHLKRYLYRFAREHGDPAAKAESFPEQVRINTLYSLYQLRKLNPFYRMAHKKDNLGAG